MLLNENCSKNWLNSAPLQRLNLQIALKILQVPLGDNLNHKISVSNTLAKPHTKLKHIISKLANF